MAGALCVFSYVLAVFKHGDSGFGDTSGASTVHPLRYRRVRALRWLSGSLPSHSGGCWFFFWLIFGLWLGRRFRFVNCLLNLILDFDRNLILNFVDNCCHLGVGNLVSRGIGATACRSNQSKSQGDAESVA